MSVNINDFNPNINTIKETIYNGPQQEVLNIVEDLNSIWPDLDIGVSKTFRLKAGTYDRIKDHIAWKLGFNMGNSGLGRTFTRVDEGVRSLNYLKQQSTRLQDKIQYAKTHTAGWQDNTDIAEESMDHIRTKLTTLSNFDDDINVEVSVLANEEDIQGVYFGKTWRRYRNSDFVYDFSHPNNWVIKIDISSRNKYMNVHLNERGHLVQQIPMGNMGSIFYLSFSKLLGYYANAIKRNSPVRRIPYSSARGTSSFLDVFYQALEKHSRYEGDHYRITHPFVNSDSQEGFDTGLYNGQCFGDLDSRMAESVWGLDLDALVHYWNDWSTNYIINSTNPLNNIRFMYFGVPNYLEPEYNEVIGRIRAQDCNNVTQRDGEEIISNVNICMDIDCQVASDCSLFQELNDEDLYDKKFQMCIELDEYFKFNTLFFYTSYYEMDLNSPSRKVVSDYRKMIELREETDYDYYVSEIAKLDPDDDEDGIRRLYSLSYYNDIETILECLAERLDDLKPNTLTEEECLARLVQQGYNATSILPGENIDRTTRYVEENMPDVIQNSPSITNISDEEVSF